MANTASFISATATGRFGPAAFATPNESNDHTGPYTLVWLGQVNMPYQPSSQNTLG